MKKSCIAMLLAGGQGSRLYALTQKVAKPSMPFGGKYRIIDFPLSNCANSGIDTVGVLTQYRPLQLNSYIGSGQAWDMDTSDGGVFILPPYQSAGKKGSWFSGTANAIYQNMSFIEMYDPDNVLILSGDHIYKMNYDLMLRRAHRERRRLHHLRAAGIHGGGHPLRHNERGRRRVCLRSLRRSPSTRKATLPPWAYTSSTGRSCAKYLIEDEADPNSDKDFGKNIIPKMLANGEKLWPYRFEGYWRDVGTITSLWDANMDMLSTTLINLYDASWPIMSNWPPCPPHYAGA
jgi:glucose-1-phosphate adenylyltransferase